MLRPLRTLGTTGAIVVGLALAAYGLFCLLTPDVWCDFRPMSPGGTCASYSSDDMTVHHQTFEEKASAQLVMGWVTLGAGFGLAVVFPLVQLVRGNRRTGGGGGVPGPPSHRLAPSPGPTARRPGPPHRGQGPPSGGPVPRQGRSQPPPRPPHPRRPPHPPGR